MPRRTTLTLDDDVARRLDEAARKKRRPLGAIVNEALRRALDEHEPAKARPFQVTPRAMGVPAGVSFDCVEQLLDEVEGPFRR